jgi:uncharacterized damage-inducible protein DinB
MPKQIPITPIYARGDVVEMLDAEYAMLVSHIEDLSDDQLLWRPSSKAHCISEILWHLYFEPEHPTKPKNKKEALNQLKIWYEGHHAKASEPKNLAEPVTWWTGDEMTYRGYLQGFVIRHIAYHYGQIVALRQGMGVDEGKFYHEK